MQRISTIAFSSPDTYKLRTARLRRWLLPRFPNPASLIRLCTMTLPLCLSVRANLYPCSAVCDNPTLLFNSMPQKLHFLNTATSAAESPDRPPQLSSVSVCVCLFFVPLLLQPAPSPWVHELMALRFYIKSTLGAGEMAQ